jgi:hypothetical protein
MKKKAIQVQVTTELDVLGHFPAHESKTLQLDAQYIRGSLNRKFFGSRDLALAFFAFISIVSFKPLATEIMTQSII